MVRLVVAAPLCELALLASLGRRLEPLSHNVFALIDQLLGFLLVEFELNVDLLTGVPEEVEFQGVLLRVEEAILEGEVLRTSSLIRFQRFNRKLDIIADSRVPLELLLANQALLRHACESEVFREQAPLFGVLSELEFDLLC